MIFLSLGAGVQSSTLALMAAHGELPYKVDAAIMADTQAEPQSVYNWLELLKGWIAKAAHPYPVYIVSQGDLEADSLKVIRSQKSLRLYQKNLIPLFIDDGGKKGILKRKCTSEYKIRIIQRKQRELLGDALWKWRRENRDALGYLRSLAEAKSERQWDFEAAGVKPISKTLIGISTDESQRVKPSREPWTVNHWPLLELGMSRMDCLAWLARHNYPKAPRSACVFCPYHSDEEWLRLKNDEPQEFARAVKFDYALRRANQKDEVTRGVPYLHADRVPLDKVQFDPTGYREGDNNETDCAGICGV